MNITFRRIDWNGLCEDHYLTTPRGDKRTVGLVEAELKQAYYEVTQRQAEKKVPSKKVMRGWDYEVEKLGYIALIEEGENSHLFTVTITNAEVIVLDLISTLEQRAYTLLDEFCEDVGKARELRGSNSGVTFAIRWRAEQAMESEALLSELKGMRLLLERDKGARAVEAVVEACREEWMAELLRGTGGKSTCALSNTAAETRQNALRQLLSRFSC